MRGSSREESDYKSENRIEDVEMEIGEGENFRRIQEYRGSKMRERLEIKKEIWKRHRERSEMSYKGKNILERDNARRTRNKLNHSENFHYILPSMKINEEQNFERQKKKPLKKRESSPDGYDPPFEPLQRERNLFFFDWAPIEMPWTAH